MKTRDIVVDLIQAGHETRNPRYLILATDELQVGEALQDATKDEVIGQHGLDLIEQGDPLRRIFLALHWRLLRSTAQGRENPAGEEVERDRGTCFASCSPESVIDRVSVV